MVCKLGVGDVPACEGPIFATACRGATPLEDGLQDGTTAHDSIEEVDELPMLSDGCVGDCPSGAEPRNGGTGGVRPVCPPVLAALQMRHCVG